MKSTRNIHHAIRRENGQFAATIETSATIRNQESINLNLDHWAWLEAHGYDGVQPCDVFATPVRNVSWSSR